MNLKNVLPILALFMIGLLPGCNKDTIAPLDSSGTSVDNSTLKSGLIGGDGVGSTNPKNGALSVSLDSTIRVTFNQEVDLSKTSKMLFTLQGKTSVEGTVSFTKKSASFKPSVPLTPNTTYIGRVSAPGNNLSTQTMNQDYAWTFSTGTILSPMVLSTNPFNSLKGEILDGRVSVKFNVPMDPLSITASTFTVNQGSTPVLGVVSFHENVASFTSTVALTPFTTYTGTITTGARSVAGNSVVDNYEWTFVTGASNNVVTTNPVNNATGVNLNQVITANFRTTLKSSMMDSTLFVLKQGSTNVAGSFSFEDNTVTFVPTVNLIANTVYNGTVTIRAKNASDHSLGSPNIYTWSFTTGSDIVVLAVPTVLSVEPANNASSVVLSAHPAVTFSAAMNPSTISSASFTVYQGTNSVAGTVAYSGTTAMFTPASSLVANAIYTATVTTAAKNAAGTALANNYVWNFTTSTGVIVGTSAIDLKSAANFGILSGLALTGSASSVINNGNVGLSPGFLSSIIGFPPTTIVNGTLYAADGSSAAMLLQAKQDLTNAYLAAQSAVSTAPVIGTGDQGGKTLAPGIYKFSSTMLIQSGDLTLDAKGDVNAVWIFQVGSALTTVGGAGGNVILSGGAQAKNIFWQVTSSTIIGANTAFKGNILALTSITLNTGATIVGRVLARNAAVTLTGANIITLP